MSTMNCFGMPVDTEDQKILLQPRSFVKGYYQHQP